MGHKKRQRLDRTSTAAYAANQPLLTALKHATESVSAQTAHLENARDTTQSLHVNIVNGDHERHEEYMNSIVRAYKLSVDSYCTIFESLVSITAAEPSEGREAGKRHEEFAVLLATAERAKKAMEEHELEKINSSEDGASDSAPEEVKIKKEPVSEDEDETEVASVEPASELNASGKRPLVAIEPNEKPATEKSLLNAKLRHDKSGKVIWEDGELKVPHESLTADERKAWGIIQERARRGNRRSRVKAKQESMDSKSKEPGTVEPDIKAGVQNPAVEFEDITDQVEARLKAKAEKKSAEKAAKKAEKKRKRESGDSFIDLAAEKDVQETKKSADNTAREDKPEKPAKKKPKKTRDVEAENRADKPAEHQPTVNGDHITGEAKEEMTKKRKELDDEIAVDSAKDVKKKKSEKSKKRSEAERDDAMDANSSKKRKKVKRF